MSSVEWGGQQVITAAAAKELVQALRGEREEVRFDTGIRVEPALQALKDGWSLTEIIQHTLERLECYLIIQVLEATNGNKAETARILKIDYKTLYRKMFKYFGTFSDFVPGSQHEQHPASVPTYLESCDD